MKNTVIIAISIIAISGCSTTLNGEGALVRAAHDNEDLSKCEFRGSVTAKSPEFALTPGQEAEYALNDLRNKVGARGGNVMKLLTNHQGLFTGVTMSADSYRCEK